MANVPSLTRRMRQPHLRNTRNGARRFAELTLVALVAAALAGCAGSPAAERRENIAYQESRNIPPVRYKDDLPAFFRTYLNDPTGIRDAAIAEPVLMKVDVVDRYIACVRYNAKKSGGQYAGVQTGAAVYIGGKFDTLVNLSRRGGAAGGSESSDRKNLRDYCATAAYEPLPEITSIGR